MDWQPIETAPKDERILLWCADHNMRTKEPIGVCMGRNWGDYPMGEGMSGDWTFTHWMPLPEPPENV